MRFSCSAESLEKRWVSLISLIMPRLLNNLERRRFQLQLSAIYFLRLFPLPICEHSARFEWEKCVKRWYKNSTETAVPLLLGVPRFILQLPFFGFYYSDQSRCVSVLLSRNIPSTSNTAHEYFIKAIKHAVMVTAIMASHFPREVPLLNFL